MSPCYYQVGGFRPDVQWTYDIGQLASFLCQDRSPLLVGNISNTEEHSEVSAAQQGDIELILGITKAGTSHLLLTEAQMRTLDKNWSTRNRQSLRQRHARPHEIQDFESLSPIRFRSAKSLQKKLEQLKPKKTNQSRDTSAANFVYGTGTVFLARSAYEHGRIFYQFLNNMLSHSPDVYGLNNTSWTKTVRVGSFVYNTWDFDDRPRDERLQIPNVLDYGYCLATLPSCQPQPSSTVHIVDSKRETLRQRNIPMNDFLYGNTMKMKQYEISAHLCSWFNNQVKSIGPLVLLVFKAKETLACLKYNGVDTSSWRLGIRDLLQGDRQGRPARGRPGSSSQSPARFGLRSASPKYRQNSPATSSKQRSQYRSSRDYGERQETPSDNVQGTYAPVYVLDIQDLYRQVTTSAEVLGIPAIASRFLDPALPVGWCAGNEASLLVQIWQRMISGLSVDEQRELGAQNNDRRQGSPTKQEDVYENLDDDERDPNEIPHNVPAASSAAGKNRLPEEESASDDSDDVSD